MIYKYPTSEGRTMANSAVKVPTFTVKDQEYFRVVYEAASKKFKKSKIVLEFLRSAYKKRFGNEGILHEEEIYLMPDKITLDLRAGKEMRELRIKEVPFDAKELTSRIISLGYNWEHKDFGVDVGNLYGTTFRNKLNDMLSFFSEGREPPEITYSPPKASKLDATFSDEVKAIEKRERGVHKKSEDLELYPQRLHEQIPLDEFDEEFLNDVESKLKEKRVKDISYLKKVALGIRYSNYLIDERGCFLNTRDGGKTATIELPVRNKNIKVIVKVNLPKLKEKFDKYRYTRDFVKDPLFDINMNTEERMVAVTAAGRWLERGKYAPRHASEGEESVRDHDLFVKVCEDYDKYLKGEGENPNIADKYSRGDFSSFYDLLCDDARRAINSLSSILIGAKANPEFDKWINNQREELIQHAMMLLTVDKTGMEGYKQETKRYHWIINGLRKLIERSFESTMQAFSKDDFSPINIATEEDKPFYRETKLTTIELATYEDNKKRLDLMKLENIEEQEEEIKKKVELNEEEIEQLVTTPIEMKIEIPEKYLRNGKPTLQWLRMTPEQREEARK